MTGPERRAKKKAWKAARRARAGSSPDSGSRRGLRGAVATYGWFVPRHHPTREVIGKLQYLSDKGLSLAMNMQFRPATRRGSEKSLRSRPRGLPGRGCASWLPKLELLRRIAALDAYVGVRQYEKL
jgi:hypothetical protein